jgi:2-oxo-hept-3-ene-1,7-dioate hydratase
MSSTLHYQIAGELLAAETSRRQIGLVSKRFPAWTMEDAYAVQAALVARKLASGRRIIGWKIGLTSRAMQDALKIAVPDSGVLLDDMLFDHGATVPPDRYIQPRIEAEIAFIMKQDLNGPLAGRVDVLAATAHVAPALEILDTRIQRVDPETSEPRTFVDTIADNAANAGIVLGSERHAIGAFDLRWIGAILKRNGEVEETGLGAGVLDDPATGVLWLANRLAETGNHISAGDIVLSGSFIRPVEARSGDRFSADFGAFGSVAVSFA